MLNNVRLRAAKQSDARAIADVYIKSRKYLSSFAPLIHTDESIYRWIKDILIPIGHVLVAENNCNIIGMLSIVKENNIGWIEQLYLSPLFIGQGIGSMFIDTAKNILGSPIRLNTFQENTSARGFYERHGFRLIELRDGSNNEEQCPDAVYEWQKDF